MPNKATRTSTPRRAGANRGMLYLMLGIALLIIVFLIVLYPLIMVGSQETVTIRIPKNATVENVRDSLETHMGKDYASKVMRLIRLRNVDFAKRNGAYEIPAGTNAFGTMRRLTTGGQTPIRVTINGFRSLPLLVERVSQKMEFPADSLWSLLSDSTILEPYGLTPDDAMSLFVEDTYEFYWNTSPRDVLKKFGENYEFLWSEGRRKTASDLGLTPAQVMVLASIVDEETNQLTEKGKIGRLYINRLKKGMKLQADPTVRFALQDFTIKRILKEDLKTESAYNTYLHPGLPPGPIRTTSKQTVIEILTSQPSDYLYMCAKDDFSGFHNFASTYEEHTRNALRYQQALDSREIVR